MTTTLIVGCGYLGRRVGRKLSLRSERVLGTTRSEAKAADLAGRGVEPVVADVLDPSSLRRLPEADRALYCVGFDRSAGVPMRSLSMDGLRNVLEALAGRVSKLVYTSSTSVYGIDDGGWVDEDSPTEPKTESGLVGLDAERRAQDFCDRQGIECVVMRSSGLYGPGRLIRREALKRGEPIVGDPSKYLNLIHIDDAASAAVAALDRGVSGRVYLATDDRPIERREYYTLAASLIGGPGPRFVVRDPKSLEEANKRVSNRRIKAELGLTLAYPDIRTGLPATIVEEKSLSHGV